MSRKEITVPVDGVPTTFNNGPWDAVTNPNGLAKTGWRQGDNLFNLLLGVLGAASPALQDASTTALTIATGNQVLTLTNNMPIPEGIFCMLIDTADVNNFMFGQVTDHTNDQLTVDATVVGGSGSDIATWTVQPCGPKGTVAFASDAQAKAGTASNVAVTPANLEAVLGALMGKRSDVATSGNLDAFTRTRATASIALTLPTFAADEWLVVERDTTAGSVSIPRNSQTIDGAAADFVMDINKDAILFYCVSAGVVITKFIGVLPQ